MTALVAAEPFEQVENQRIDRVADQRLHGPIG
jgi:hypothetical protein